MGPGLLCALGPGGTTAGMGRYFFHATYLALQLAPGGLGYCKGGLISCMRDRPSVVVKAPLLFSFFALELFDVNFQDIVKPGEKRARTVW